jgi:DNA-directed RNA polymerase subunit L
MVPNMEIKIIEETKNKIVFEIKGEDHTFSNILRKELWNDNHVKAAAYNIDHPLTGIPCFILQTDGEDPKKVLKAAVKRIEKELEKLKEEIKTKIK